MKTLVKLNFSLSKFQLILFTLILSINAYGQKKTIDKSYRYSTIQTIGQLLNERYVFPDKAQKISIHIEKQMGEGFYNRFDDLQSFADAITGSIYELVQDKHISVTLRPQTELQESGNNNSTAQQIERKLERRKLYRRYNANFKKIEKLDGNIGYLDLRGFYRPDFGKKYADMALDMLATSDAIIIDLRSNSGGRADMVQYLLSHFFKESVVTSKAKRRTRRGVIDEIHSTYTNIENKRLYDVPLIILTSKETFSAAEAFAYPLQVYKRATIIGEVTKGGAHAGNMIPVNRELQIFIPDVAGIHPLTNENWEGKGVVPDIKVKSTDALDQAIELAFEKAKVYALKSKKNADSIITKLFDELENQNTTDQEAIVSLYLECRNHDIPFEEWELNELGYELLSIPASKIKAEAVLKANTRLYPNSANVYDSYGDALLQNGKTNEAIINFKKAVILASENNDENLQNFKENLSTAEHHLSNAEQKDNLVLLEEDKIRATLLKYIEGTSDGHPEKLNEAFHLDFNLYSVDEKNKLRIWDGQEYISRFKPGEKHNRIGKIISIDFEKDVAVAKAEITIPDTRIFTDYFLLVKYEGQWKIVHKSYSWKKLEE